MSIIEVKSLLKTFVVKSQDVPVLKGIDFIVQEKDFVILFGQSGCGKSTLLHIILGLEKPTSGAALLYGKDYYSFNEDERAQIRKKSIGMIYQQPNWIKSLTVIENVAFVASLQGIEKGKAIAEARKALERVGMGAWADYRPTELSSGQQQKVALARALISDPKIIIADEPTGNLDYRSGIELMNIFRELNKQGKTIIMVSHNIENVEYATRVVHMFDGKILRVIETSGTPIADIKAMLTQPVPAQEETVPSLRKVSKAFKTQNKINFLKSLIQSPITLGVKVMQLGRMMTRGFLTGVELMQFLMLLMMYLMGEASKKVTLLHKIINPLTTRVIRMLERHTDGSISRVDLIDISVKNMLVKKTRTLITIGGMAIGIGAIVFLVSVGYGLEKLVISRVARLDEMRHIDATPIISNNIKITDKQLSQFKDITGVNKVLPVIGVVGKVDYNHAVTDIAVYGTPQEYLTESAIRPIAGRIFNTKVNSEYAFKPANSLLNNVAADNASEEARLTDAANLEAQQNATDPARLVEKQIQELKQVAARSKTKMVDINAKITHEIFVNKSLLEVLGIQPQDALGKNITLSFIASADKANERIETEPLEYTIVGVTSESKTPIAYVLLKDVQNMGLTTYSQVKLITENQENVPAARRQLEVLGFKTASVVDTVTQIEKLFTTLRLILAVVGVVALSVAALGMFNTLTVSLLERTHEVGMMKAIGMMSGEVKELFLSESLVMGVFGGIAGLFLGFLMGKTVSVILTSYALIKGAGTIDITYIPISFMIIIIALSVVVGFVTGIYPAKRATKISALDALRYE